MECGYISCTNCDFMTDTELNYRDKGEKIKIQQEGDKYYYNIDTEFSV